MEPTDEEIIGDCLQALRTTPGHQMGLVQLVFVCERRGNERGRTFDAIPMRRVHDLLTSDDRVHVAGGSAVLR